MNEEDESFPPTPVQSPNDCFAVVWGPCPMSLSRNSGAILGENAIVYAMLAQRVATLRRKRAPPPPRSRSFVLQVALDGVFRSRAVIAGAGGGAEDEDDDDDFEGNH